jgi:hypothetical protein
MPMRHILIALLVLAWLGSPSARAADAAPKKPAETPKKQEPRKVDRADPRAVVVAFATAIATGDKPAARLLIKGSARQLQYADALIDEYQAIIRFDKALKDKFGREADEYLDHYDKLGEVAKKKTEIEIEGDTASATVEDEDLNTAEAWDLVKANGQWSIDGKCLWDPDEDDEGAVEALRRSNKATDEVTAKIIASRYKTAEAAVDALNDAVDQAFEKAN